MHPVVMPPSRLARFYLGGEAITRLRGVPAPAERSPQEWLASTLTRFGEAGGWHLAGDTAMLCRPARPEMRRTGA